MRKKPRNLHTLPRVRNIWSYLYVEHCLVEKQAESVCLIDKRGRVPIPCAGITLLMLGPGTSISHMAVLALTECGCLLAWVGEEGVRSYAFGLGKTRSAANILRQAEAVSDEEKRMEVVRRLYQMRFDEELSPDLTLQQIRGKEGARVRDAYREMSEATGVEWSKRDYKLGRFEAADPINRALSTANACLYGVCHAAIVAAGYSPAMGFIHTGKMLSFVYDIADLYKTEFSVRTAFLTVSDPTVSLKNLESYVRHSCRDTFRETRILARLIPDIQYALGEKSIQRVSAYDAADQPVGKLWDPEGDIDGGVAYGEAEQ